MPTDDPYSHYTRAVLIASHTESLHRQALVDEVRAALGTDPSYCRSHGEQAVTCVEFQCDPSDGSLDFICWPAEVFMACGCSKRWGNDLWDDFIEVGYFQPNSTHDALLVDPTSGTVSHRLVWDAEGRLTVAG